MEISYGVTNIPYEEWLILQEFYEGTNGLFWKYNISINSTYWNFTNYDINNPCYDRWAGIICTCYHYRHNKNIYSYYYIDGNPLGGCNVQKISLYYYNLTGTITNRIGNLLNLTSLSLNGNKLYGTIPSELNYLINLKYLGNTYFTYQLITLYSLIIFLFIPYI